MLATDFKVLVKLIKHQLQFVFIIINKLLMFKQKIIISIFSTIYFFGYIGTVKTTNKKYTTILLQKVQFILGLYLDGFRI